MSSDNTPPQAEIPDWRAWLVQRISGTLLLKLAALITLWWLFFSPEHDVIVERHHLEEKLAIPVLESPHD